MEIIQPSRERQRVAKIVRGNLLKDASLYVESVGKADGVYLGADPTAARRGRTVMRLIFGATEDMPFRSLSYIDTAVRNAEALNDMAEAPVIDQLQIIHANSVGQRINGINKFKSDDAAKRLAEATEEIVALRGSNLSIFHAIDSPLDTKRYEPLALSALEHNPAVADKLMQRGAKHGGDALKYLTVHLAFQDTDSVELRPISPDAPGQISGEQIISIGCQQERPFHLARMAMRSFAAEDDQMISETGQIFTKHVVPPYYGAKGGELSLKEGRKVMAESSVEDLLELTKDIAARRDIHHFITVNTPKEQ